MALANYFRSKFNAYNFVVRPTIIFILCVCVFLSLAKNYWAKDIIFLVTSHDEVGMQAWIDAYMGLHTASKNLAEVGQACETSKRTVTKKYICTREKKLIMKV